MSLSTGLHHPRTHHPKELKNKEFSFTVELSSLPCGFNAALYFVGMTENRGSAEEGVGYCDAQAVAGTFCSELDPSPTAPTW